MKNLLLVIVFFTSYSIFSQHNELGLTLFKFEKNTETYNFNFEPKLITGINYTRHFKHFQWFSTLEYGENEIDDNCNTCADHISGIGVMKEVNLKSGIGYGWNKNWGKGVFLTQFRFNAVGSWLNYSGYFSGGFGGYSQNLNRRYLSVGGELEFGVGYQMASNFTFRLDISTSTLHAWTKNKFPLNSGVEEINKWVTTFPRLSIGYRF